MVIFDFVIIVCVAGLGVLGFKRGFIKELVETVGALLAAIVAFRYHEQAAEIVGISSASTLVSKLAVFFGVFILIMVVLSLIGHFVRKFLRVINLGLYERLAGFVLGALKGGIVASVLTLAIVWSGNEGQELVAEAKYARANLMVFDMLTATLPESIRVKYEALVAGPLGVTLQSGGNIPVSEFGRTGQGATPLEGKIVSYDRVSGKGRISYVYRGQNLNIDLFSFSVVGRLFESDGTIREAPVTFEIGFDPLSGDIYAVRVKLLNDLEDPIKEEEAR